MFRVQQEMKPPTKTPSLSSLAETPPGIYVRIHELRQTPEVTRRLRVLGIREHSMLRCIHHGYGNIICEVMSSRISLNNDLADSIMVRRQEP